MSWSYNLADLSSSQKDQVRFIIGDTLATAQQVQDEEINFAISQRANIWGAAAECARSLAARFAREADSVQGDLHTLYSSKSKAYRAMALEFENKSATNGAGLPYAGGISIVDKQEQEQDGDRVPPQFQLGQDDNYIPVSPAGPNPMVYPTPQGD